jgi:hypothetical protein
MPNTTCLSGPPFSITGEASYAGQQINITLSFDSSEDQAAVDRVEWYLDGVLLLDQHSTAFSGSVYCGSHHIGARVLSAGAWSGVKQLAFQTCKTVLSTVISGPGYVLQDENAVYHVIASFSDGTTSDVYCGLQLYRLGRQLYR